MVGAMRGSVDDVYWVFRVCFPGWSRPKSRRMGELVIWNWDDLLFGWSGGVLCDFELVL